MSDDPLFVYGTLRPACAPAAIAEVVRTLRVVAPARLRGRLFDLGDHPGAVADPDAPGWIHGDVVVRTADSPPLAWFDAYEDCVPDAPERSLFLRERHAVESAAGSVACWVWVLPRAPAAPRAIPSGTWRPRAR